MGQPAPSRGLAVKDARERVGGKERAVPLGRGAGEPVGWERAQGLFLPAEGKEGLVDEGGVEQSKGLGDGAPIRTDPAGFPSQQL